jgi:hypothetical protein
MLAISGLVADAIHSLAPVRPVPLDAPAPPEATLRVIEVLPAC